MNGAPREVGGEFKCHYNELTTLEGSPKVVGDGFDCSYNKLTSLKGAPEKVGGYFSCHYNNYKFTENDVLNLSNVEGEIWV